MNRHVYNGALLVGWLLVSVGAGMHSIPAGFVVSGALLVALTIYSARLARSASVLS